MIHGTVWMNLKKNMLSKRRETQKTIYTVWFYLCEILEKTTWGKKRRQLYRDSNQISDFLGLKVGMKINCKETKENILGGWKCSEIAFWWW